MTTPLPLGSAPYVSSSELQNAPTGIDWSTIPATPSYNPQAQAAEIWNMCSRASAQADEYCNQVLQATVDIELLRGPDYYVTTGPGAGGGMLGPYWGGGYSNARLIMGRWPILAVNGVMTCPNNQWPRQWTSLPTGYYEAEVPPIGIYGTSSVSASGQGGQAVIVGGGYIDWTYGRNGYAIQVNYTNGWPNSALTVNSTAGSTSLVVNDTTGWAVANYFGQYTGATGVVKDSGQQEAVHCASASTSSGPGTLFLSSPMAYAHEQGILVTTLPASIEKACIYFATAEAMTRGATTTSIQSIGGHMQSSGNSSHGLCTEAELLLHPYRRTI